VRSDRGAKSDRGSRGRPDGGLVTSRVLEASRALVAGALVLAAVGTAGAQETYPTAVWTELPPDIVSEAGYRSGFGTGMAAGGETVELRPGSPFVRLGRQLVQLANPPFLDGGRLHVPLELLARPEFETPSRASTARAGSSGPSGGGVGEAGSTDLPPVVVGESARRPGPWRVVIDPGHGGHDPGTQSPRTGAKERDITLSVSKMIYEELDAMDGIEPSLTRDTDRFIILENRPRLAIQRNGDLFVSIHVDAQPKGTSAKGFTTYYLGPARTELGRQAAIRENTVPGAEDGAGPDIDQLEFILAGLDQGTHLQESVRFGGFIQNELRKVVDSPDRGVRSGPYWVLVRATSNMPTVLVELGFITNATEERRLRDRQEQRAMARAIATAIHRYLDEKQDRLDALAGGR